jgi:hypothetical protein
MSSPFTSPRKPNTFDFSIAFYCWVCRPFFIPTILTKLTSSWTCFWDNNVDCSSVLVNYDLLTLKCAGQLKYTLWGTIEDLRCTISRTSIR